MRQKLLFLLTALLLLITGNAWGDRVYFNDFNTGSGTTAPDGLTIRGDGSFVDEGDSKFGMVFQNGGGAQRTHYLQLPADALSHSASSKKMTIGFWVNKGNAGASDTYMWAPLFTAYGDAPNKNANTWPMLACQYRGVLQVNNTGWCDYVDCQNVKGSNTLYHDATDWLADAGWHYYTVVFDNEIASVYFDGVLKNQWNVAKDYWKLKHDPWTIVDTDPGDSDNYDHCVTTQAGLYSNGGDLNYVCLGGNQAWNYADNDAAFKFDDFAVYDEALTPAQLFQIIAAKKGLTVETYDFSAANSTNSSQQCTYGSVVKINGTDCNVLSNTKIEMNDRFAGQVNNSNWNVYKSNNGLGTTKERPFGILNLSENDYVSITFAGTAPTFIGGSNISGKTDGTAVVSGELYQMTAAGNLELNVPKAADPDWTYIKSITILTSAPVLSKPTVTFNNMVESGGLYYPQVTITGEDGVTFKNGSDETITSPYTFTSAGTLTVYAVKDGHTNSATATYSVTAAQIGTLLTNSIDVRNLYGVYSDYSSEWPTDLDYTLIPNVTFSPISLTNGCTYRTTHSPTVYNALYARNKAFTATCSNLSEDEVVVFANYTGTAYTPCTSASSSLTVNKDGSIKYYNLYTQPTLTQSITVSTAKWKTLVSQYSLDFTSVDGLKAYIVTGGDGGVLAKTQVKKVPAGTALLLNGSATTYNVPVIAMSAATDDVSGNKLVGVVTDKEIAAETGYVLMASSKLGFYKNANVFTVGANTAYLPVGFDENNSDARSAFFGFEEDPTAINAIEAAEPEVDGLKDGKFLENGKVIIVKNGVKYGANGQKLN